MRSSCSRPAPRGRARRRPAQRLLRLHAAHVHVERRLHLARPGERRRLPGVRFAAPARRAAVLGGEALLDAALDAPRRRARERRAPRRPGRLTTFAVDAEVAHPHRGPRSEHRGPPVGRRRRPAGGRFRGPASAPSPRSLGCAARLFSSLFASDFASRSSACTCLERAHLQQPLASARRRSSACALRSSSSARAAASARPSASSALCQRVARLGQLARHVAQQRLERARRLGQLAPRLGQDARVEAQPLGHGQRVARRPARRRSARSAARASRDRAPSRRSSPRAPPAPGA